MKMSNKHIKLTLGSKCDSCGYNHNPPSGLRDNIQWHWEYSEGYHRSACSHVNTVVYPKTLLFKLLSVFGKVIADDQ